MAAIFSQTAVQTTGHRGGQGEMSDTKNSATYANVMMRAAVYSCSIPQPIEISITPANITLRMGAAGQPDEFDLSFTIYVGAELTFTAQAALPPGTLRSRPGGQGTGFRDAHRAWPGSP